MGHTVVLGLDKAGSELIHNLTEPFGANKIPFGRNCSREDANQSMDYHMTLCHWPKGMDAYNLPKLDGFRAIPCQIYVNGTRIMQAEENSWLLYFDITPSESFLQLASLLESHTGLHTSCFYHITLAVSKDYTEIQRIDDHICRNQSFPFVLNADRLDLYHIWRPTRKVRSY